MKGKSIALMAVALALVSQALPCSAAKPYSPYSSGERQAWPKWYYYDQVGLRSWHKGDKDAALNYFDQSYKMAESALNSRKPLDYKTKAMVRDVINHQLFHMTVWNQPSAAAARTTSVRELATIGVKVSDSERDRQLRWLERLEAFAKRCLGPNHLDVQALEKHRHFLTPEPEEDTRFNTQGKANHGTVVRPKWYTNNERDFTPEMFTRNPRKLHEAGTEDQKKMDVTKLPDVKMQKGFTYVAGKKIDLSKVNAPVNTRGWAGGNTVGTVEVNNPNVKPTGWGGEGAANYGDGRTTDITKWGIGGQEQSAGGKKVKQTTWGSSSQQEGDVFNKPWGGGPGTAGTEEQKEAK
jgi:hypothetical protein